MTHSYSSQNLQRYKGDQATAKPQWHTDICDIYRVETDWCLQEVQDESRDESFFADRGDEHKGYEQTYDNVISISVLGQDT